MASNRIGRINEEIQRELSTLIRSVKDPRVTGMISVTAVDTTPDLKFAKIYISVRSRVKCGDLILHPSKVRLLRRMIRDEIYRSRPFEKTIKFYHSVELGEERYIMPYKYRSTYDIDTFIDYELNVLKAVLPKDISFSFEAREVISDLLYVLAHTDAADPSLIPESSLIREFIGGSKFSY